MCSTYGGAYKRANYNDFISPLSLGFSSLTLTQVFLREDSQKRLAGSEVLEPARLYGTQEAQLA